MPIEMQQLHHVCAVAEHGQIAAAARAIPITQPALSRSIRNLEDALGVTLFERSRQGVAPTAYGAAFLEHARVIIHQLQRAEDSVAALRDLARGRVSFGLTANFDDYLIPEVVGALRAINPGISVSAVDGFYEDLSARVRTGELDFAFALLPANHGHPDLSEELILPVRYKVYAPVDHPLAKRRRLTLVDITAYDWVMPEQPTMRSFERYFEVGGCRPPRIAVRTTSTALLTATLRSNQLLSMLPEHLVERDIEAGRVVELDIHALPEEKHAGLIYRSNAIHSPAAGAMMKAIRENCARRTERTNNRAHARNQT